MIWPETPARRLVVRAWATSRPPPVCEAVLPRRSRAAAITSAAIGADSAATAKFRPRTPV